MVGLREGELPPHPDLEPGRSSHPRLGGHPVEQIVAQMADLGGPGWMVDCDHQDLGVHPHRLYVLGHGRPHDLLPTGKQPA